MTRVLVVIGWAATAIAAFLFATIWEHLAHCETETR